MIKNSIFSKLLTLFLGLFITTGTMAYPSLDDLLNESSKEDQIIDSYIDETRKELVEEKIPAKVVSKKNDKVVEFIKKDSVDGKETLKEFNSIKPVDNDLVRFFIKYYSTVGRAFLKRSINRMKIYFPLVKKHLIKNNLPLELSVLAIVESGYNPEALSHKVARGMWQLMPLTGKIYNLKIGNYIDERMDIDKSTEAAILYLKSLGEMFNKNWDLVIASYNGGGGYISSLIRKHKKTDFWKLCKISGFWSETLEFVPRFYAILHILKNAEKYNFTLPGLDHSVGFEKVTVPKNVQLKTIAKSSSIPLAIINKLNPHFKKCIALENCNLFVPKTMGNMVVRKIRTNLRFKSIVLNKEPTHRVKHKKRYRIIYYKIRRGDSISKIAKKFRISSSLIYKYNRIKKYRRLSIGKVIKVLKPISNRKIIAKKRRKRNVRKKFNIKLKKQPVLKHIVKSGDTLFRIAKRYRVSPKKIIRYNRLANPKRIFRGMVLKIPVKKNSKKGIVIYRVKKGDTLFRIARKFNTSIKIIMKFNRLKSRKTIAAGKILKIPRI